MLDHLKKTPEEEQKHEKHIKKMEEYKNKYWNSFKKTLEEHKLDQKLEEMTELQANFMKDNPQKITTNVRFPRLEQKLEEENLINAEMVGATDTRVHKYSFVHQEKAVAFLASKIIVKDVNNLILNLVDPKKKKSHV